MFFTSENSIGHRPAEQVKIKTHNVAYVYILFHMENTRSISRLHSFFFPIFQ